MKIGVSSIGYNSRDLLNQCFKAWNELKSEFDIKICFSHGCFVETYKLNFPILSEDGTHELASSLYTSKQIDHLIIYDTPQLENQMWSNNYYVLRDLYNIDLLIMVNVDEIWTVDEIKKLLKIVQENQQIDYFKINFKNYCIDYNTWVDDFIVPRVWYTKKNNGIKAFYKDDLVEYNNEKKDIECPYAIISKDILFPKHYSWVGSKEYLLRKLNFQKLRYGLCSYTWDYTKDKLCLNDEYYNSYGVSKPILNYDN